MSSQQDIISSIVILLSILSLATCIEDEDIPVIEGDGGEVKVTVESDVLVLTEENFDILVSSKPIILVEFYAPWCGHCKTLEPQYAKAASILKENDPPIPLGKVDATVNEGLAKRFDVTGFPTILLFRKGVKSEYDGPRTAQGIVDWMKERADPNWKPPPETVITLTGETFDDVVSKETLMLVEFYAPWCGHCKALAPEYERAAKLLEKLPTPIKLAKVDATLEKDLAVRYNVQGYPTLFIFRRGKHFKYDGPRDELGIYNFMKKQQESPSIYIHSLNELEKKTPDDFPAVLGVFSSKDSNEFQIFEDAINQLRSQPYAFLHVADDSIAKQIKESPPSVVIVTGKLLRTDYEPIRKRISIKSDTTSDAIVQFIGNNSIPLVGHRSRRTLLFYHDRYPLCVVYYDVDFSFDGRVDTNIIRQKVVSVAKKFKGQGITFAVSHESDFEEELKDLGLEDAGEDVNAGLWLSPKEKYAFAPEDEFEAGLLEEFIDDVLEGKVKPVIKSQPMPERQEGPVLTVVGSSFDSLVTKSKKNVLIEFYAPWCGHCKKLEPIYRQLAEKFKDSAEVVIAKFDATANDAPVNFEFSGFPTIFYVPVREKNKVNVYEGDRTLDDLIKYVNNMLEQEFSRLPHTTDEL